MVQGSQGSASGQEKPGEGEASGGETMLQKPCFRVWPQGSRGVDQNRVQGYLRH